MPERGDDRLRTADRLVTGLTDVLYGLPERRIFDRAYLVMHIALLMDASILASPDQIIM